MKVTIISFSYKRGLPADLGEDGGGFVFDCRMLPNPFWDESLRRFTGCDRQVTAFMDAHHDDVESFMSPVRELVTKALRAYAQDARERLHVAFGCTGGQHRSVYCAESLADFLRERCGAVVEVVHAAKEFWKV